jgi:hypothetical protein
VKNCFVKCGFSIDMSAAMMTVRWNSCKMKRMTGTIYNLLEWGLKTTQHGTVLSRSVEPRV